MVNNWYPQRLLIRPTGNPGNYEFLTTAFKSNQVFHYAEFGIYNASTVDRICQLFPNAIGYLFDFHETIERARMKLAAHVAACISTGTRSATMIPTIGPSFSGE
jgi:hypothetical protein